MVEDMIPPITTTDNGYCISLPTPVAKSSGSIPNSVVNAVIKTGRSLSSVASLTKSYISLFGEAILSSSMNDTNTMPLSIAMANMAMNPTIADILKYSPLMSNPAIPPMSPNGTPSSMRSALLSELNAVYSIEV